MKPPWLEKIETSHSHMKAFLAPPVPQEALRNMDMVLDYTRVLLEALERMTYYANGIAEDGRSTPTPDDWSSANKQAQEALNYNPEVKHD